jgi:hypothetical protein
LTPKFCLNRILVNWTVARAACDLQHSARVRC